MKKPQPWLFLAVILFTVCLLGFQAPYDNGQFLYSHISSNASTQVDTTNGYLHGVVINTKGASANTATIYDSTACPGTKVIGIIDTTAGIGMVLYDVHFINGLCVTTATGTAADLTISYK